MRIGSIVIAAGLIAGNCAAFADGTEPADNNESQASLAEIVVTAQKREQSVNEVGLSISTVDAGMLERRDISDPSDLAKVVPGLNVANAGNGATLVYTLRGVGFNASFLGATSAVAVYQDEVALPYPAMTGDVGLDLERVEVLKGPQGTLFGQNSTAGAINYIAHKPTDQWSGYVRGNYGRFNWWNIDAAAGGPLTDTLKVRVAISHEGGDGWQKSYTRKDTLGSRDNTKMRAIALWTPLDSLRVNLTVNYWNDKSDTQALQLLRYVPLAPPGVPQVSSFPTAPQNDRAADWDPNRHPKFDINLLQPSLRVDYEIAPKITLTSLGAYSNYRTNSFLDVDGTIYDVGGIAQRGSIEDYNEELRLSGRGDTLNWVIGGDIQRNQIHENLNIDTQYLSNTQNIGGSGISAVCPDHATNCDPIFSRETTHAQAVFINGDYKLTDELSLVAGARYTDTSIAFRGCNQAGVTIPNQPVPGVTSSLRDFFNVLYGALSGNAGANPIPDSPTACITLDNVSRNGAPPTFLPTESAQTLSESNVSWNVTGNYKPTKDTLLYARIARGYKSGSFPTIGASTAVQFLPARQESLLAYEGGYKLTLLDHRLQFDGALFYYDYKDKQLSNFVPDAVFGPLVAIVNVPKSRVLGSEMQAAFVPMQGLSLRAAVTYVDTRITRYNGFNVDGAPADLAGQRFNLTPMWSGTFDVDYRFPISDSLSGYLGAGTTSNSRTSGVIGSTSRDYDIRAYTTLDLQAGIESSKGWTAGVFGKNVTDTYYWTNVNHVSDTIVRVAGLPAMYGVRFGYHF